MKEDVIAGRSTFILLEPRTIGAYDVACAEYCGLNHSRMYTKLHVLEDDEFEKWLEIGMTKETDLDEKSQEQIEVQ